jgi:hypothetical protein
VAASVGSITGAAVAGAGSDVGAAAAAGSWLSIGSLDETVGARPPLAIMLVAAIAAPITTTIAKATRHSTRRRLGTGISLVRVDAVATPCEVVPLPAQRGGRATATPAGAGSTPLG